MARRPGRFRHPLREGPGPDLKRQCVQSWDGTHLWILKQSPGTHAFPLPPEEGQGEGEERSNYLSPNRSQAPSVKSAFASMSSIFLTFWVFVLGK